jgi:hypothetical protein
MDPPNSSTHPNKPKDKKKKDRLGKKDNLPQQLEDSQQEQTTMKDEWFFADEDDPYLEHQELQKFLNEKGVGLDGVGKSDDISIADDISDKSTVSDKSSSLISNVPSKIVNGSAFAASFPNQFTPSLSSLSPSLRVAFLSNYTHDHPHAVNHWISFMHAQDDVANLSSFSSSSTSSSSFLLTRKLDILQRALTHNTHSLSLWSELLFLLSSSSAVSVLSSTIITSSTPVSSSSSSAPPSFTHLFNTFSDKVSIDRSSSSFSSPSSSSLSFLLSLKDIDTLWLEVIRVLTTDFIQSNFNSFQKIDKNSLSNIKTPKNDANETSVPVIKRSAFPSYAIPVESFDQRLPLPPPPRPSSSTPSLHHLISLIHVFLSFKMESLSSFNYTEVKSGVFSQLFDIIIKTYEQCVSSSMNTGESLFSSPPSSFFYCINPLLLFLLREALLFEVNTGYHEKVFFCVCVRVCMYVCIQDLISVFY